MSTSKLSLAAAGVISALAVGVPTQEVEAANWLMLQGTERTGQAGRAKVWGFVQPEAQYIGDAKVKAGRFSGNDFQPNTIGPDRNSRATMNIRRARIGVRGQGFPLDNKVNYFFLSEFGHNGINVPGGGGGSAYLTDASITLNHIPYARLRIGQFKTPGSEEGLQAIHVFDYINFTNGADQLLLERFADGDGSTTTDNPLQGTNAGAVNKPNGGVGAFRDIGAQLFDTVKVKNMEYSYAAMIGNGNGINRQDNNNKKDFYGYAAAEMVFGGKGGRRDGAKVYAWMHKGKRTLTTENNAGEHDRDRSGLGFTYRKGPYRAAGEYIMASGLIRNGTDGGARIGTSSVNGVQSSLNYLVDDKANAYYLHLGYAVLPKVELDLRYDVLNRGTDNNNAERKFSTTTVGVQYFLNKKTRIILNYEFRNLEVPNTITHAGMDTAANANADEIENRASVQMLAVF